MNNPNNLDALRSTLAPMIEVLEAERQRVVRGTVQNAIVTAIVLGIITLLVMSQVRGLPAVVLFAPLIVGIIIVAIFYSIGANTYRAAFKSQIISQLVSALGYDLQYSPQDSITETEFRSSQLFRAPDRYKGEDLIDGCVGATRLRFSEVHAEYRTRDSKGRESWHTIFRGLFFIADFNKEFNGITLVLPDTAERIFGKFGQSLQAFSSKLSFSNRELVKLEDPEFERTFVVYSTDQIEARYLLSPSLMRRLLDFRQKAGTDFHAAFFANHIYLAVPLKASFLEPPTFGRALDINCIEQYLTQLRFVLGIVEDLDLNTRIWSKQ